MLYIAQLHTFEAVAAAWMDRNRLKWTGGHVTRIRRRFEQHVFPWIGERAIRDVAHADVLHRIERTGRVATIRRVL